MINKKSTKLEILLVDNNFIVLHRLQQFLGKLSFVDTVVIESKAFDAYTFAQEHQVDVLIMSMEMEDLDGVHLVKALSYKPEIIFMSSNEKQAATSYRCKVKYWLQKPVSFVELKDVLEEIYRQRLPIWHEIARGYLTINVQRIEDENLSIKRKWYMMFPLTDIAVFTSIDNYIMLVKSDGKAYSFRGTLIALEAILPMAQFKRVHKGYIVNINHCERFSLQSKSNILFVRGYEKPIPLNMLGVQVMKMLFDISNNIDNLFDKENS